MALKGQEYMARAQFQMGSIEEPGEDGFNQQDDLDLGQTYLGFVGQGPM